MIVIIRISGVILSFYSAFLQRIKHGNGFWYNVKKKMNMMKPYGVEASIPVFRVVYSVAVALGATSSSVSLHFNYTTVIF